MLKCVCVWRVSDHDQTENLRTLTFYLTLDYTHMKSLERIGDPQIEHYHVCEP